MFVNPNKNCPHIYEIPLLPIDNFRDIPFSKIKCENCEETQELWVCISCGKFFCSRYINNHFYSHSTQYKNHCICISMMDLSIWCYNCTTPGFIDAGSYIENPIANKYVQILVDWKFGSENSVALSGPQKLSNLLNISKEKIFEVKYCNFIELLRNDKINNIIFFVGAGISTTSGIPDFRSKDGFFNKIKKPEDFFSKELFLNKPELLYKFLKVFVINDYKPSITHYFIRYLIDRKICKYVFTQNFDGLEIKAGISPENIIFAHGNLGEGHCAKCNKEIDIKPILEGIKNDKVFYCDSCNGPCKPKIVLYSEDLPKKFYECSEKIKESDMGIIVGTSLQVEPFSSLPSFLDKQKAWTVLINNIEVDKFDFDDVMKKNLFLKGEIDEVIKRILNDCGWMEDFKKKYNIN